MTVVRRLRWLLLLPLLLLVLLLCSLCPFPCSKDACGTLSHFRRPDGAQSAVGSALYHALKPQRCERRGKFPSSEAGSSAMGAVPSRMCRLTHCSRDGDLSPNR